jgi:hypothetical protein
MVSGDGSGGDASFELLFALGAATRTLTFMFAVFPFVMP